MAPPRGSASYKKKPGTIALTSDTRLVTWTAVGASSADISIPVQNVANLQQTPANHAKVMLKVFEQAPDSNESIPHTFTFAPDDTGRAEAGSIRDALSKAIQALKSAATASSAPTGSGDNADGASAAMAIAAAVSYSGLEGGASNYDDDKLLKDDALQADLLKRDKRLADTFQQALRARPSTVAITAFNRQFWSSRVRLLRAFAIEKAQKKSDYHVLGVIKPHLDNGESKISLAYEQIQMILKQYPVVREALTEYMQKNTPSAKAGTDAVAARTVIQTKFWTEFFMSRLCKKLRGEKINDREDKKHPIIDKYLDTQDNDTKREQQLLMYHVPHMIDLEGNTQDNSQKLGNDGDKLTRSKGHKEVPVMRTLNAMSERLLSNVASNDVDPSAPIGVDEATYNEIALKDLAGDHEAQRRLLNIRDKAKFFATGKANEDVNNEALFTAQDPKAVLQYMKTDVQDLSHSNLAVAIGVDQSDSEEDLDDEPTAKSTHVGSRVSRRDAVRDIFASIRERRDQAEDVVTDMTEEQVANKFSLSVGVYNEILLANTAAVVFLTHFWSAYHSGDASRAGELQGVVEALQQYLETFKSIADLAEKEREDTIRERQTSIRNEYRRNGTKLHFDPTSIKGGRMAVEHLFSSTSKPIRTALETHAKALLEARKEDARGE